MLRHTLLASALSAVPWLLPALLPAQELAWKLPRGAVVEYKRVADQNFGVGRSRMANPPRSAQIRDQLGLKSLRNPPLWFEAELDADRQSSTESPTTFWDIIPYVALSLDCRDAGSRMRFDMPRIQPIGDLLCAGRATAVIDGGVQELTLNLRSSEPKEREGPRKYFNTLIERHYQYRFRGKLEIRRVLDPQQGLVKSFHARLEGTFYHPRRGGGRKESSVLLSEEWTLHKVHGHRDVAFRKAVVRAIQTGADRVKHELEGLRNRRLKPNKKNKNQNVRTYNNGRLALAVLTLVKAEVDRKDKILQFGMEELRKRVFYDSYSTGLAIMAMEAFYAPRGERDELINGLISSPRKRELPAKDMALVNEWTKQILSNQDIRMDRGYRLAFNYNKGARRYDHSVNQYALLGLYSAHLCGARIPGSVWISAARHLIDEQRDEFHKPLRLQLDRYGDRPVDASSSRTVTVGRLIKPRGWAYYGKNSTNQLASGGMTAAGIAGLTICTACLHDMDLRDQRILREAHDALQAGYAWFASEFSVRANAGYAPRYNAHRFYYLYSMERAFELAGIERVQGRDWYHEGARMLLAWQNKKNGSWPAYRGQEMSLVQTCFAVLFLKKAALPVLSGKRGAPKK